MVRSLCLFVLFGLPLASIAQERPASPVTFDHVTLPVQDIDRSVGFYRDVFGLEEIVNRSEVEGIRWLSLGEGKELHLISVGREPVISDKAQHFALTTATFDAFMETLQQSGIAFFDYAGNAGQAAPRADGRRQLYLEDPDGHWIEVNSAASD